MGIIVSVIAADSKEHSSVRATGSVTHIISDEERKKFGIDDKQLKDAVKAYFGKSPNDAYVKSPTPWDDLYKRYGWPQVKAHLDVISAEVLELTSEPVALSKREFRNDGQEPAKYTAEVSDTVTETAETNWSETYGLEVGQTISYGVEFSGVNIGGETSLSFSEEFGKGGSQSKETEVSSTTGVEITLKPGQSAIAELTASRGTLKIQIGYRVSLTGDAAVNYNPTYKGHHFWALPINAVMAAAKIATSYEITETIEVGYYSNGEVTILQ